MDCFAQAAAYLAPSIEILAKLSSIIPVWMALVMADKHLMGLPLLEGSIWRSPRIPPQLTITPNRGKASSSRSESSQYSGPASPNSSRGDEETHPFESVRPSEPSSSSPFEPTLTDVITQIQQPTLGPLIGSHSPSSDGAPTTALSIFTPLEMHDPLFHWGTAWYESNYYCIAVMVAAAMLILGILNILQSLGIDRSTPASRHRDTKDVGTQFPESPQTQLLVTEYPIFWEFVPTCEEMKEKQNQIKSHKELKMQRGNEIREGPNEVQGFIRDGGRMDTITADVTAVSGEADKHEGDGDGFRSEASKVEEKEGLRSNIDKEDGGNETANNSGDDGLDGTQVDGGSMKKKKKRRVRGNAKQRAAKRAAAAELDNTTEEASNATLQDQKQREHEEGKPKQLGSEEAKLGGSDALATP